jgi:hypothetical protein
MKLPPHPRILERSRDNRLRELAGAGPLLAASLVEVAVRCGRPGCHCASGGGHPSFYLTLKREGKTRTLYVPKDHVKEVRQWVSEHKRIKTILRQVSELSLRLLRSRAVRNRRFGRQRPASAKSSSGR